MVKQNNQSYKFAQLIKLSVTLKMSPMESPSIATGVAMRMAEKCFKWFEIRGTATKVF